MRCEFGSVAFFNSKFRQVLVKILDRASHSRNGPWVLGVGCRASPVVNCELRHTSDEVFGEVLERCLLLGRLVTFVVLTKILRKFPRDWAPDTMWKGFSKSCRSLNRVWATLKVFHT